MFHPPVCRRYKFVYHCGLSPSISTFSKHRFANYLRLGCCLACHIYSPKKLSILISCKRNPVLHPPLFINGTMIKNTSFHKHLGLTFSNTGSWDEHVKSISEKSWSRLNLLKALKFRVSGKSLEKIYFAYIRPLLEYSDTVWNNCSSE